jgi:hypothetical protein
MAAVARPVARDRHRASRPTDNLHDLSAELEGAVKHARDGGMLGSGANDHRRALKHYQGLVARQG